MTSNDVWIWFVKTITNKIIYNVVWIGLNRIIAKNLITRCG